MTASEQEGQHGPPGMEGSPPLLHPPFYPPVYAIPNTLSQQGPPVSLPPMEPGMLMAPLGGYPGMYPSFPAFYPTMPPRSYSLNGIPPMRLPSSMSHPGMNAHPGINAPPPRLPVMVSTANIPHTPVRRLRAGHACDHCRRRKIRCDALQPGCSNCRAAGIGCCYSGPPQRMMKGSGEREGKRRESGVELRSLDDMEKVVGEIAKQGPVAKRAKWSSEGVNGEEEEEEDGMAAEALASLSQWRHEASASSSSSSSMDGTLSIHGEMLKWIQGLEEGNVWIKDVLDAMGLTHGKRMNEKEDGMVWHAITALAMSMDSGLFRGALEREASTEEYATKAMHAVMSYTMGGDALSLDCCKVVQAGLVLGWRCVMLEKWHQAYTWMGMLVRFVETANANMSASEENTDEAWVRLEKMAAWMDGTVCWLAGKTPSQSTWQEWVASSKRPHVVEELFGNSVLTSLLTNIRALIVDEWDVQENATVKEMSAPRAICTFQPVSMNPFYRAVVVQAAMCLCADECVTLEEIVGLEGVRAVVAWNELHADPRIHFLSNVLKVDVTERVKRAKAAPKNPDMAHWKAYLTTLA